MGATILLCILINSLRWVREATVENPWGWTKPEEADFQLNHIALGATPPLRARNIPEYDVDAVLSAGELVIDEEERALLNNLGLEPYDASKHSKKNVAQKMSRQKREEKEDPLTKPLGPEGMS